MDMTTRNLVNELRVISSQMMDGDRTREAIDAAVNRFSYLCDELQGRAAESLAAARTFEQREEELTKRAEAAREECDDKDTVIRTLRENIQQIRVEQQDREYVIFSHIRDILENCDRENFRDEIAELVEMGMPPFMVRMKRRISFVVTVDVDGDVPDGADFDEIHDYLIEQVTDQMGEMVFTIDTDGDYEIEAFVDFVDLNTINVHP